MRLTLGPLQYFWPRERVLAFYREAAGWPLDVIYLGENVCSKRRELATRDWIALAHELAGGGREVVLSSLALLAPGRLTLGVGVGGEDRHEIEAAGIDPSTRGKRMDESLTVLRALLEVECPL